MAGAFGVQLGSTAASATGGSIVLTTANAVAAGSLIVVVVGWWDAAVTLSSLSGGGLTWAIDKTFNNGNSRVAICSAQAPSGLAASTAITANYSATTADRLIGGFSLTGMATSSPVNNTGSAAPASGTAWTAGAVSAAAAGDVVVGANMGDGGGTATSTPTAGWTEVPATAGDFGTGVGDELTTVYQVVAAGGSFTPGGTWTSTRLTAGASVAYLQAGAVTPRPRQSRRMGARRAGRTGRVGAVYA